MKVLRLSPLPVRERMKVRVRIQRYARVRILPNVEIEKVVGSVQSRIAGGLVSRAKSIVGALADLRSDRKEKSRILNRAGRCRRTLTFILSLTGRGDRTLISSRTCEALVNRVENFLDALEHLVVPEAKHPVAARVEKRSAGFVFLSSLEMLRAVQLDDEAPFGRAEISEVGADRKLTAEFGVAHLAVSQVAPQDSFGVGLFESQAAGVLLGRYDRAHLVDCLLSGDRKQEQNPESRRALYSDPHLHPLPYRERRQRRNSESRSAMYLESRVHSLFYGERTQTGRLNDS
jgi:hypothetical protein